MHAQALAKDALVVRVLWPRVAPHGAHELQGQLLVLDLLGQLALFDSDHVLDILLQWELGV